jgi:hypothetical protein
MTTLKHERTILTTLYLDGVKNIDSWHARKENLQRAFPLHRSDGSTIYVNPPSPLVTRVFWSTSSSLKTLANCFNNLGGSPEGGQLRHWIWGHDR